MEEKGKEDSVATPQAPSEANALFIIGSCAAFASYIINKARGADLLTKGA